MDEGISEFGSVSDDQPQSERLTFSGSAGELFPIVAINLLLTILTLGIYRFWARTRVRRYLWGTVGFRGDAFEYTGTGLELFIGFLIAIFAVYIPFFLFIYLYVWLIGQAQALIAVSLFIGLYLAGFVLFGVAIYRARRYRLSRSSWRGIRMGQTGSSLRYGLKYLWLTFLSLVTLGWIGPFRDTKLYSFAMNNTLFGDRLLRFSGKSRPLYKPFAIFWVGTALVIIIGSAIVFGLLAALSPLLQQVQNAETGQISLEAFYSLLPIYLLMLGLWIGVALLHMVYVAAKMRYFAANTRFEELGFSFDISAVRLVKFTLFNVLLMIITFGLGTPFVQLRTVRLMTEHLTIEGGQKLDHILQSIEEKPAFGEGLAEAFDIGNI